MLSYAIRRVLGAIPTLFIIITIAFFMMRLAPGGPFDGARRLPPEIERNIAAAYDLDKPLYEQFFIYLGKLLQGDFGPSFKIRDFTVSELIMQGFPVSLRLGVLAMTLAMVVGTTLGVIAALRQNRPTDYSVMSLAMVGICIPSFVTAPLLQLEDPDFVSLTETVMQWADVACDGRVVSCLEGGYNLETLGPTVAAHVAAMAGV